MAKNTYVYSVWKIPQSPHPKTRYTVKFHIVKYHRVHLIEQQYYTMEYNPKSKHYRCDCPGFTNFHHCRHQEIVERFIVTGKINTGALYDYDKKTFSNEFAIAMIDDERTYQEKINEGEYLDPNKDFDEITDDHKKN